MDRQSNIVQSEKSLSQYKPEDIQAQNLINQVVPAIQPIQEEPVIKKAQESVPSVTAVYTMEQYLIDPIVTHLQGLSLNQVFCKIVNSIIYLGIGYYYFYIFGVKAFNYLILQEVLFQISSAISDGLYQVSVCQLAVNLLSSEKLSAQETFSVSILASTILSIIGAIILVFLFPVFQAASGVDSIFKTAFQAQAVMNPLLSCLSSGFHHRYRLENRRFLIFSRQLFSSISHLVFTGLAIFFGGSASSSQIGFIVTQFVFVFWNMLILSGHSMWHIPLFDQFQISPVYFLTVLRDVKTWKPVFKLIVGSISNILCYLSGSVQVLVILNAVLKHNGSGNVSMVYIYFWFGQIGRICSPIGQNLAVLLTVNKGHEDKSRISTGILRAMILGIGGSGVVAVIFIIFYKQILSFFMTDETIEIITNSSNAGEAATFGFIAAVIDTMINTVQNTNIALGRQLVQTIIFVGRLITSVALVLVINTKIATSDNYLRSLLFCDCAAGATAIASLLVYMFKLQVSQKDVKKKKQKSRRKSIDEELAKAM
ncbi:Transmembrane_domain-containing protein [Hexamita inflata]|uniref:Transmembrane domain-containing protein n=1 Tax=Hexamita inflata TaxID=28002 RepID=A0AA86Q827_9EUKA|nr:Transmembrane domain-containing protein [Hexamita inflata]